MPERSTDVASLLRRAATYLETLGAAESVDRVVVDRDGADLVLTATFDHGKLPTDLEYLDPRFAADFDAGDEPRDDFEFMLTLADEVDARTIVDLGCGTGRLTTSLATGGRRVIGVDPAPAMIAVARERPGAERVEWLIGDVSAIETTDVDLILMTGNISGYIVEDDEWSNVLDRIRAALRQGGRFAFGSRNPDQWGPERWGDRVRLENGRVHWEWSKFEDGRVHAGPDDGIVYGDEVLVADSQYRLRSLAELQDSLAHAGFHLEQVHGGWDRRSVMAAGDDLVFVARSP